MSVTPDSVKALLESEDFGQRLTAVNQLRQLDPSIAFDLLQQAIGDSNTRVRYAAVSQMSSLGQQNPALSLDLLRQSLHHDPEPDVQAAAADSLAALKLTEAFADLQAVYHQTQEWLVQFSIIAALGELGEPQAFDLLQEALTSDTELVRTAAIGALGELKDDRALPLLFPFISDDDWQVRHRATQALSNFDTPEIRSAMETLSQDESEPVAVQAKSYLAER